MVETLCGRSVEVVRIIRFCRAAKRLRPSVFQHSKVLNFTILDFGVWSGKGFWGHFIVNSRFTKSRNLALKFYYVGVRGLERQGILESLHCELPVHEITSVVGSGEWWPERRWIKDTCTWLSPWEVHRKKDMGHNI